MLYTAQEEVSFYADSWALLIGINEYQFEKPLNYAVADAEEMQRLLVEKLGFPEKNIEILLDDNATLNGIKKSMQKLAENTSENDRVLIYFAGHGFTQPLPSGGEEGYLIPINGKSSDLFSTSIPMSEMNRLSNMTPAKDMLFLMDACYSGLMGVGSRGLDLDVNTPNYLKKISAGGSRTVITAGKKGEIAQERAEWGHSPFVKNIKSGLEKGMADTNGDGYITDRELGNYLTYQVTADTDNKQTPVISHFTTDQGQFVFIIGDVVVNNGKSTFDNNQSVDLDYDRLADKIADRMKSSQSLPNEQNEEQIKETDLQTDSEGEIAHEIKNMESLAEEMEELGEEMEELGEEMEDLGEDLEEEEDVEKREAIAEEMEELGEEMEELGEEMEELGEEMEELGNESVNELLEKLKDLGIESEEISKISGGVKNGLKNKIGLTEGKLIANCTFANSQTRYYADEPEDEEDIVTIDDISKNNWWRYNRSEGLFYQMNGVFQSPNIKGSSFYGGVGRAFHRNEYQWTLGLEQLVFKKIFQFYAEVFNKSITPDAWRLWDGENSLSTLFRRQDYLDWYNGRGYRAAGFIHIKNYVSIGAEYNQFTQSEMNNVLEGDKFREAYHVQEGDNIFLKTMLSVGYPVELSVRDEFQMYTTIIRTSSMENADINYSNDHLYFNILIPYAEKLNFNIKIMAGASDVAKSIWKDSGYRQNIFEIGGEGTLRGYDWKGLSSSHYQLTTLEAWFGSVGVFYDRAILFDSPGNVFNSKFLKDLSDNMSQDAKSAIGFILGRKNLRLSFAKQMTGNNTTMYLTFGTPLQYW
ncbi:MAG: caspase family protein [Candidatus Marinimicrobia bacterium]|nr:caspase family protein [Candidatus Neomarinimicrobiota bacterium]